MKINISILLLIFFSCNKVTELDIRKNIRGKWIADNFNRGLVNGKFDSLRNVVLFDFYTDSTFSYIYNPEDKIIKDYKHESYKFSDDNTKLWIFTLPYTILVNEPNYIQFTFDQPSGHGTIYKLNRRR